MQYNFIYITQTHTHTIYYSIVSVDIYVYLCKSRRKALEEYINMFFFLKLKMLQCLQMRRLSFRKHTKFVSCNFRGGREGLRIGHNWQRRTPFSVMFSFDLIFSKGFKSSWTKFQNSKWVTSTASQPQPSTTLFLFLGKTIITNLLCIFLGKCNTFANIEVF